jgi:hypothetical protein
VTDLYDPADDWRDEDDEDQEPDDDDRDDYGHEPDEPEWDSIDSAEYWNHRDEAHGGEECDCGSLLRERLTARASSAYRRLTDPWRRLNSATRHPWTLRAGPVELTLRLRADRRCGACGGRGWNYSLTAKPEHPVPPGYNGAALCGCGSAIGKIAETRRCLRRTDNLPPF